MRIRNLITAALTMTVLAGAASGAMAETRWQHHHPRRAEVNARLGHQNHRIAVERREGLISGRQAHDLHAQDRGIRAQERFYASRDGGHISRGEQHRLNREENGVSRELAH